MRARRARASATPSPATAPPLERFHKSPDDVPGVTLIPAKPATKIRIAVETFDKFDRWADAQNGGAARAGHINDSATSPPMARLLSDDMTVCLRATNSIRFEIQFALSSRRKLAT